MTQMVAHILSGEELVDGFTMLAAVLFPADSEEDNRKRGQSLAVALTSAGLSMCNVVELIEQSSDEIGQLR